VGDQPSFWEDQMRKGDFNHDAKAQLRARDLRAGMSVSEKMLWARIRKEQLSFAFRTQVRVDRYYMDFYCARAKLCVEVDGQQHAHQRAYDKRRDEILRDCGIYTLRIPAEDLFDCDSPKLERWLNEILRVCQERAISPTPNPLPQRQTTLRDGAPDGGLA
jgi:very-short-patch-repair endonuclease